MILGTILFIRFISSLKLEQALFFSNLPLILVYGAIIFLIADLSNIDNDISKTFQSILNITADNSYNTILWAVLITIVFIGLMFLNYYLICRPMGKVERVVSRLGDGKIKNDKLTIGGGKQFKNIEHGLNKINNNYMARDNTLRTSRIDKNKNISKQLIKILGNNNIMELELGRAIKKQVTLMNIMIDKEGNSSQELESEYKVLNYYYKEVSPIIKRFSGYIYQFDNNGIKAIFPHSDDALSCSLIISRSIRIKNRTNKIKYELTERISILTTEVTFKAIEREDDKTLGIISDEFTLLNKIDRIAEFMKAKIIFSKSVIDDLPLNYKLAYRYLGSLDDYNIKEILLFENLEVYPRREADKLIKNKGLFERGIICYNNGDYNKALQYFQENIKNNSNDKAGYIYYCKTKEKLDMK